MSVGAPKVSVVMPVRDREDVIERAVASVLAQTMADFELIVVDDGSTDGTLAVIRRLKDPRIRLCQQHRLGANPARNRGILEACAPLIAFLDSDDEFLPQKLATVVARFEREPDLGTLVDSYFIIGPDGTSDPVRLVNRPIDNSEDFLAALLTSTVKSRRLRKATSGITIRREVAIAAGLFDEAVRRRQDMEFLIRAAKAARCATTDEILWVKHEQAQSISFTGEGFIASTLLMYRAHAEYRRHPRNMPADVVMYLWETWQRRGLARAGHDWRSLARGLGTFAAVLVVVRGAWAWLVDARVRAP